MNIGFRPSLALLAIACFASSVAAHPGHGSSGNEGAGLLHYLVDHSLGGWALLLIGFVALAFVAGKPLVNRLLD